MDAQPEVWLRGPVPLIPPALMPAAHAFMQTMEDVEKAAGDLTVEQVWRMPGGAPSVGFHLVHLAGSTDRLVTYARGERLSPEQRAALTAEQAPPQLPASVLIGQLRATMEAVLTHLRKVPEESLYDPRTVGRAALPTTAIGLLFHAAEHSQRHAGQVVTTAKIVRGLEGGA